MRTKIVLACTISTSIFLTACENNPAIFRHVPLIATSDPTQIHEAIITDAKQRILTRTHVAKDGSNSNRIDPKIITCTEPSPDVAQAISNSISAALAASLKGGQSVDASVSHSTAESIAQLGERIATIQLLRDELSDLCRSYANGAVTATTYTLRLSKLDRKMVTLLIGEMTAGAFGRSLASISGSSGSGGEKIDPAKLQEAQERVKNAQAEVEKSRKSLESIKPADDVDGSKRSAAQNSLTESTKALHSALQIELALRRGQLSTNSGGGITFGIGTLARGLQTTSNTTAGKLALIQRQFLEHDDMGTIIDACLTSMDLLTDERRGQNPITLENLNAAREKTKSLLSYQSAIRKDLTDLNFTRAELDGQLGALKRSGLYYRPGERLGRKLSDEERLSNEAFLDSKLSIIVTEIERKENELRTAEKSLANAEAEENKITKLRLDQAERTPLSPLGRECQARFEVVLETVQKRHSEVAAVRKIELETEKLARSEALEIAKSKRLKEEAATNTAAATLAVSSDNLEKTRLSTETLFGCRAFMQAPAGTKFPDVVTNFCTAALEKMTPK